MHHRHHRRARRHARHWAEFANGLEWAFAGCGPQPEHEAPRFSMRGHRDGAGGEGRRRLLRHLANRLDLSREQIADTARILERLKIERAQAEVDQRRTSADLADAIEGERFDTEQARGAAERRVEAARHVQDAVARALAELHAVLDDEQRGRLATLIRTRAISF